MFLHNVFKVHIFVTKRPNNCYNIYVYHPCLNLSHIHRSYKNNFLGVPDWLGLGPTTRRAESPSIKKPDLTQTQSTHQKEDQVLIRQEDPPQVQQQAPAMTVPQKQLPTNELSPQNINAEIQNTYSSLHQQESLLLVSLQFKKYEETLKEIQEKQEQIIGN